MSLKYLASTLVLVAFVLSAPQAMAQRGGKGGGARGGEGGGRGGGGPGGGGPGGGGMQRGGGPSGGGMQRGGGPSRGGPGGGMERGGGGFGGGGGGGFGGDMDRGGSGGGFGGGLSQQSSPGGIERGGAAMGPYGGGAMSPRGGQTSGGPTRGTETRPGVGAGGAGGPASGIGLRPGVGAGGAGGPASGIGVRPGLGAGGAGGPASGVGVLPGAGAGRPGVPGDYAAGAYGTHYTSAAALDAQGTAFRAAAVAYPAYSPAAFAGYAAAWHPTNVVTPSLYQHPGYGSLAVGLGLNAQPIPYDYGGNVVAQSSTVYVNGDVAGTPQQYADQASQIAASGVSAQPAQDSKWLPLGVFALVEGDATTSDDIFQLAVNPQGILRGNYHNVGSDQVESLSGSVDKTTQRAAWTIGDDKAPVYEAGIANLTKDATPVLVHLGNGQSRQVSLIRLEQPSK